jgi:NAD(P)-dependent dehydrogenase (short-subunit alcohol dehydrogenase family)
MALRGLAGKAAVVTGGAGGIGRATARRLAVEGAKVAIVDLDAGAVDEAVADVSEASTGGPAVGAVADVSTEAGADAAVAAAVDAFGRLDLYHNNAGIEGPVIPFVDYPIAEFDRVIAVNVRGVFLCMQLALRQMVAQGGGGSIVNMSSLAGFRGSAGMVAYTTSKHAVIGLTRCGAQEGAPHGIRVNSVHPGVIDTRMLRSLEAGFRPDDPDAMHQAMVGMVPLGRAGTPEDVASLVVWLLSDEAEYVSGSLHAVDGGVSGM